MRIPVLLFPAIGAASLAAQTTSAVSILNGNMTYTQGIMSTTETATTTDSLDGSGGDILFQHWWWFRVAGDTREFAFKDNTGSTTRVAAGANILSSWPDVDARGVFAATLSQDLVSTSATGGFLRDTMTITNLTASPLTIDLFSYVDYDIAGPGTDIASGDLSRQVVVDQTAFALAGEFSGVGVTASQVTTYAGLLTSLQNTTVTNLAGWPGTFGPADYTGALQWTLTIPGNGTASVVDKLATLTCRPSTLAYGSGTIGVSGTPQISSTLPVMADTATSTGIRLTNGAPNSLAALLLGLQQANVPVFGFTLLVNPSGVVLNFAVTNGSGAATFPLGLPAGNRFCGTNLDLQWLVSDATAPGGLAAASPGLQMTLGAW